MPTTAEREPMTEATFHFTEVGAVEHHINLPHPDWPLEVLHLPTRAHNAFVRAGLRKVGDVPEWGFEKLAAIPNVGVISMRGVVKALLAYKRWHQMQVCTACATERWR